MFTEWSDWIRCRHIWLNIAYILAVFALRQSVRLHPIQTAYTHHHTSHFIPLSILNRIHSIIYHIIGEKTSFSRNSFALVAVPTVSTIHTHEPLPLLNLSALWKSHWRLLWHKNYDCPTMCGVAGATSHLIWLKALKSLRENTRCKMDVLRTLFIIWVWSNKISFASHNKEP